MVAPRRIDVRMHNWRSEFSIVSGTRNCYTRESILPLVSWLASRLRVFVTCCLVGVFYFYATRVAQAKNKVRNISALGG